MTVFKGVIYNKWEGNGTENQAIVWTEDDVLLIIRIL